MSREKINEAINLGLIGLGALVLWTVLLLTVLEVVQ